MALLQFFWKYFQVFKFFLYNHYIFLSWNQFLAKWGFGTENGLLKRFWDFLRSFKTLSWFLICEQKVYSRARYTTLRENILKEIAKVLEKHLKRCLEIVIVWPSIIGGEAAREMRFNMSWQCKKRSFQKSLIKCQKRRRTAITIHCCLLC